jgi:hypothetical protein
MKTLVKLTVAGIIAFAFLQLIRPGISTRPATAELQAPPEVRHILEKDCYSCHSDQRRLSWFDEIVPAYWLVRHDILTARSHLNFSTLGSAPPAVQRAKLFEAVNMIQLGAMPLRQFTALHPGAKVTAEELTTLKAFVAPWDTAPSISISTAQKDESLVGQRFVLATQRLSLSAVEPERNGLVFDPSFENWGLLSTTDRGDNNTFRFVLGNDIAVEAARSGNISPWPDGARFAKIAWEQELGPDGLIHPGKFVQVELMVKDARDYIDTAGWGWGRWRGLDLKPYGGNARFVDECTGCHMPVHDNDYVYTLPITSAHLNREQIVNNAAASLPASLPWQPLRWRALTMYVDPKTRRTATLYGNDTAKQALERRDAAVAHPSGYPSGTVLALVTWAERDDPHWFGGRIPDTPLKVEFVQTPSGSGTYTYRLFEGKALGETHTDTQNAAQRTDFILNLKPVSLP